MEKSKAELSSISFVSTKESDEYNESFLQCSTAFKEILTFRESFFYEIQYENDNFKHLFKAKSDLVDSAYRIKEVNEKFEERFTVWLAEVHKCIQLSESILKKILCTKRQSTLSHSSKISKEEVGCSNQFGFVGFTKTKALHPSYATREEEKFSIKTQSSP